jgi:sister chromatid cohesion protein DCC1
LNSHLNSSLSSNLPTHQRNSPSPSLPPSVTHPLTPYRLTITSTPSTATTPGYALLCHGTKKYQMRQKNTSNPIMILCPSRTKPGDGDDLEGFMDKASVTAIAKIEDTVELILEVVEKEGEKKVEKKVNKWHEKFARSRGEGKK